VSVVKGITPACWRAAQAFITWRDAKSRNRYESMLIKNLSASTQSSPTGSIRDTEGKFLVSRVFVSFAKLGSRQFDSNRHGVNSTYDIPSFVVANAAPLKELF